MVENARLVPQAGTWLVFGGAQSHLLRNKGNTALHIHHLRIAGAPLHIHPHTSVSIHGTLHNPSGADALVLLSAEESTASLIHHTDGVQGTVQRFIPAVTNWQAHPATDWHMISAPVAGQSITDFIPGEGGYDFYGWSEEAGIWMNYRQQASFIEFNGGLLFNEGQGYLVAYELPQLFSFSGALQAGDISCNSLTITPPNAHAGWHLLGNPYAAALDWNSAHWQRPEVNDEVHVWDRHTGNYIFNNNGIGDFDGVIHPHQAMFVKASDPGKAASLDIPAAARQHGSPAAAPDKGGQRQLPLNTLRLQVQAEGSPLMDATYVLLRHNASHGFDPQRDAHKLQGSAQAPALYSRKNGQDVGINSLVAGKDATTLPLRFRPGGFSSFVLTADGADVVDASLDVLLLDLVAGTSIDLRRQRAYAFTGSDDAHADAGRFLLVFRDVFTHSGEPPLAGQGAEVRIYAHGRDIYVDLPALLAPAGVAVVAPDGRRCGAAVLDAGGLHLVDHRCGGGMVVVVVSSGAYRVARTVQVGAVW